MQRTIIGVCLALTVATIATAFGSGICGYHPRIAASVEFQDGFRLYDHRRRIECGLGLRTWVLPLGDGTP